MAPGLTWGLAGCGDLAEKRLAEALSKPPHRLAAVWGRNPTRAQAFGERFKIPRAAGSLDELFEGVDGIYVAMPPSEHIRVALAAVQAGRHVLIEKPLSPTFAGYERLSALVAEKGVTAAVAYYRRLAPAMVRLREIVAQGRLGQIRSVELTFARSLKLPPNDPKAWRLDRAVSGGGVLADAGCHRLDLLSWIFGPCRVMEAQVERASPASIERKADLTLAFAAGFQARCRFSWDDAFADRLVIQGEQGTASLDPLDQGCLVIELRDKQTIVDEPPPNNLHVSLVQQFGRAVLGGEPPLCTLSEAHQVDTILEAVYAWQRS